MPIWPSASAHASNVCPHDVRTHIMVVNIRLLYQREVASFVYASISSSLTLPLLELPPQAE